MITKEKIVGDVRIYPLNSFDEYKYVVTLSRYQGKFLLSRHRDRSTWECQGGHIEAGETVLEAAKRELWEECGAAKFTISPLCDYRVGEDDAVSVALLADIEELGPLPESEIAEIRLFDRLPENITYQGITPYLFEDYLKSYQLIVTDLDMTLLREDKTLSDYSIQVLRRCQAAGLKVAIASARNSTAVADIATAINSDGIVSGNGGLMKVGDWTYTVEIDREEAVQLIHDIRSQLPEAKIIAIIDETPHASFEYHNFKWIADPIVIDFSEVPQGKITKIMAWKSSEEEDQKLLSLIPESCYYTVAVGTIIQIMSRRATKWNGVMALAEHWGIDREQVICFGDDIDDICMLEESGHGVAMVNAHPSVLAAAPYRTEFTSDENGVPRYLEKLLGI